MAALFLVSASRCAQHQGRLTMAALCLAFVSEPSERQTAAISGPTSPRGSRPFGHDAALFSLCLLSLSEGQRAMISGSLETLGLKVQTA